MLRLVILVLVALGLLATPAQAENILASFTPSFTPVELGAVPDFALTDQNGRRITRQDLRGKVWVAFFFYVGCVEGCADNTRRIATLTKQFAGWDDVVFVGFNIHSSKAGVAELKQYASAFKADQSRWHLLTGPEAEIHKLVKEGFFQALEATPERGPGKELDHSFAFVLVDPRGQIKGYTWETEFGVKDQYLAHIIPPISRLVQAKYLPTINAALNGLAGLLLVLGWVAIKRRWIACHKTIMLSTLVVSALFLACYLYYHFVVTDGSPTRFSGTGVVWWVYLAILLSHTILAAVVTPLALVTAYLGIRNRLKAHVWLARWTLPVWLYVSVTGVVVYWMLYHLDAPG